MIIIFLLLFTTPLLAEDSVPLRTEIEWQNVPSIKYRPGIPYKKVPLNQEGRANLLPSASVTVESPGTGRLGSTRIDGTGTKATLAVDGFAIMDISINEHQPILDLIPIEFASSADIYQQNLVPIGFPASSLIDFRLGKGVPYVQLATSVNSFGEWKTRVQGEHHFKNGYTLYGVSGSFLFSDYLYADPEGSFKAWENSTYQRVGLISKTRVNNWEFLASDTFMRSFDEGGTAILTRNNLLTGLRWRDNIGYFSTSYNLNMLQADYASGATNRYFGHYLNVVGGTEGSHGRYRWNAGLGYTLSLLHDAPDAPQKNYLSAPQEGIHAINGVIEGGISVYNPEDNPLINAEFAIALNQIYSTEYGYTAVPSFMLALKHQGGTYINYYISRVYITPDFSTRFGFGLTDVSDQPKLLPKDGIRTDIELGYGASLGRIFTRAGYSWFDTAFKLVERSNVVNITKVTGWHAELGGEILIPTGSSALTEISSGLAYNIEIDGRGERTPLNPLIKMSSVLGWRGIGNEWGLKVLYTLRWNIASGGGIIDTNLRHFLDITGHWKWFSFGILNILNQSYRPDPENPFSAYTPGISGFIGISYTWN
ncbi:MAG: hypothetical protein ACRC9L_07700 [Brevinema sp.]